MADKIFGTDFTNTTNPVGSETISINDAGTFYDVTLANIMEGVINNATEKTTLADSDKSLLTDSAASYARKYITWANIKTAIGSALGAIIAALTEKTTPVDADMIAIADSAASNATKKLTWSNVKATLKTYFDTLYMSISGNGGWVEVSASWSYASSTTITVPTDATTQYKKGWGIRFKQGGSYKYMYIIAVAATTLTVSGGSDYTVANAAITDIAYAPNPDGAFGFPAYFSYTPVFSSGMTVGNGTLTGQFKILDGNIVKVKGKLTFGSTTSISGNVNVDTPTNINILGIYEGSANLGLCTLEDVGTNVYYGPSLYGGANVLNLRPFNTGSTYLQTSLLSSTVPFTWTTSDNLGWDVMYFLA